MTDPTLTDPTVSDTTLTDPTARPVGSTHLVTLTVNDVAHTIEVPARRLLSDALRHDLRLTGTHVGCEHGVCGACTVLIDGAPARSCLTFAVMVDGAEITTVEGLASADGSLHPVQEAFRECHGLQCGYCTPGFLLLTKALLDEHPAPSDDQLTDAISGNLCRCTGYQNIRASVRRAAELCATAEAPATDGEPAAAAGRASDAAADGEDRR